jgi:hypothetical protein
MIGAVRAGMVLDVLLARQAGVISRAQALRAGLGAATVDRMVRTRRWRPLHPRVYRVPGYGTDDEARARAAVLWAGDGAVLSGTAAAWWHGLLADAPRVLGLTVPVRRPARPGVAVRCRSLAAADRVDHRGLAVTAPGLTVLEAAAELGGPAGELLLDRALPRIGWADVLGAHKRNPTLTAGPLLAAAADRSAAETGEALVRLLRGAGWLGWHLLPPATIVFPAARLAVEAVGWAATHPHGDPDSRGAGRVLRVGRRAIAGRPEAVLAAIAAAVDGRDLHHLEARIGPLTGKSR